MTTIGTVHNALDPLARNIAPEVQTTHTEGRSTAEENNPDGLDVCIDPKTLRRIQAQLAAEEPISSEQARQALEFVRSGNAEELSQVHSGLDATRVFHLLGLAG